MQGRWYGISLVWVHPNQVRAATIEEAVENLTTYTSSGVNWPYTLAQLVQGSPSCTTPQEQAPRHSSFRERCIGDLLWVDQPTQSLPTACHPVLKSSTP